MGMFDTSDIIAYYLSEYDMKAFNYLGYDTQAAGFRKIAEIFGKKDSYLRRLRDEYDVVTSSHRNGQRNRPPRPRITQTKLYLCTYSFEELSDIVESLIRNADENITANCNAENITGLTEEELERIINAKDSTSRIEYKTVGKKVRIYDHSIIYGLKSLYRGRCQLCGCLPLEGFDTDITEAHHIKYYSKTQNNDSSNIIIVCPNHHSIIHKFDPDFDRDKMEFVFADGTRLKLKLNYHINWGDNNDD